MKYLMLISLSIILNIPNTIYSQSSDRDQYRITVDGLGCPFCTYGLEKKFKTFKEIDDVNIDMETGLFTFSYPASEPLSVETVEKQVELAGYTPKETVITRVDGSVEQHAETSSIAELSDDKQQAILKTSGNCSMCKARIEKAALSTKGVSTAHWDKETKLLSVTFDEHKIKLDQIAKSIADSGHDTELVSATKQTYENLPACCLYRTN